MRIKSNCSRCGLCVRVCPQNVLTKTENEIIVSHPEYCINCGHCVDVCATDAFEHERFPSDKVHKVNRALLPSPESLMELMKSRRSNRTITDRPIPAESLEKILEAARYAPTAENSRKVRITVIDADTDLQAIEDKTIGFFSKLAKVMLNPMVKTWLQPMLKDLYAEAPGLMALKEKYDAGQRPSICDAKTLLVFSCPKGYDFTHEDCNLSYQNASLMAEALGVSQIYMGFVLTGTKFWRNGTVGKLFKLPKGHKIGAIMALGMPAVKYSKYVER